MCCRGLHSFASFAVTFILWFLYKIKQGLERVLKGSAGSARGLVLVNLKFL